MRQLDSPPLIDRYIAARVAVSGSLGECCQTHDTACVFDVLGEDEVEKAVVLAWSLQQAEGRPGSPPYRCDVCHLLTFGGCHPPAGEGPLGYTPEGDPCVSPGENGSSSAP